VSYFVDNEGYKNLLINSPLADAIIDEWSKNENLALSLLQVLSKNKIVDYNEVAQIAHYRSYLKLSDMLSIDLSEIEVPDEYVVCNEDLIINKVHIGKESALTRFYTCIHEVIPSAIIKKYSGIVPRAKTSTSFKELCKSMLYCKNFSLMYDLFITANPKDQHRIVYRFDNYCSVFNVINDSAIISLPRTQLGLIKLFFSKEADVYDFLYLKSE
jgi:hypothetical protein